MLYPRWTQNDKPRPDTTPKYMPVPRYKTEWNFRTLEPNNAPNQIDIMFKDLSTFKLYGFSGANQEYAYWENPFHEIKPNGMIRINLKIEASGMEEPAKAEFLVKDNGPGKHLEVLSLESIEWQNWIGIG